MSNWSKALTGGEGSVTKFNFHFFLVLLIHLIVDQIIFLFALNEMWPYR